MLKPVRRAFKNSNCAPGLAGAEALLKELLKDKVDHA